MFTPKAYYGSKTTIFNDHIECIFNIRISSPFSVIIKSEFKKKLSNRQYSEPV